MGDRPGTRVGPYEVTFLVGAGGMGEVYKAGDTRLSRTVAIKVSQAQFSERFAREAQAIATLNHPHICTLHDVGPDYLVMEYVDGTALTGPLPMTDRSGDDREDGRNPLTVVVNWTEELKQRVPTR